MCGRHVHAQNHVSSLAQAAPPRDGGAPSQRARIDEYSARVAQEDSFEKLAAGLNEHEDLLVTVSMWSQDPMPEMMFEVCLANRRLARLYEILQGRDAADADAAAWKLFDEKLSILRTGLVGGLEAWERGIERTRRELPDMRPPENRVDPNDPEGSVNASVKVWNEILARGDPPKDLFDVYAATSAVSAALFLSAEFCPVEEVLRQLDAWIALGTELKKRIDALGDWCPPSHAASGIYYGFPQGRFQLSLLASMLERRFGIAPGGTWEEDIQSVAALRAAGGRFRRFDLNGHVPSWATYRRVRLCAWDAKTNPLDFTHIAPGMPVDESDTFGEYLVFRNVDLTGSQDERDQILSDLRKRLLAVGALNGSATARRAQIDNYIARVEKEETIETLTNGLSQHEELLVSTSNWSESAKPEMMLEVCLANRRIARLFEILRMRAAPDADCSKLFDEKLSILRADLYRVLDQLDQQGGPHSNSLLLNEPRVPICEDQIALSAALFLSAEFCSVEEVLRQLDAWEVVAREVSAHYESRIAAWEGNEHARLGKRLFDYGAMPQNSFQLSLFATMLERRFDIAPKQIWKEKHEVVAAAAVLQGLSEYDGKGRTPVGPYYRRVPLCALNVPTNPLDFTHVTDTRVDDAPGYTCVLVFRNVDMSMRPNERKQLFSDLRNRLLAEAAKDVGSN
jgi:hypothetical protein